MLAPCTPISPKSLAGHVCRVPDLTHVWHDTKRTVLDHVGPIQIGPIHRYTYMYIYRKRIGYETRIVKLRLIILFAMIVLQSTTGGRAGYAYYWCFSGQVIAPNFTRFWNTAWHNVCEQKSELRHWTTGHWTSRIVRFRSLQITQINDAVSIERARM